MRWRTIRRGGSETMGIGARRRFDGAACVRRTMVDCMLPVLLAAMGGCAIRDQGPGDAAEPMHPPPDFYALRAAAEDELDLAVLLKPADEPRGAAETSLAPLIVQEVKPSAAGWKIEGTRRPARHVKNASGRVAVDASGPAVYTRNDVIELQGRTYDQVTYAWWYPRTGGVDDAEPRGIRLTLGHDGFPLVGEVLSAGPIHRLYISATLERLAREQYGPPLSGRAFSAEQSVEAARYSAVLRVLEDGPMPLGPYVYVTGPDTSISTLHCRCSPAQFRRVMETDYYELVPFADLPSTVDTAFAESVDLTRHLRWPTGL